MVLKSRFAMLTMLSVCAGVLVGPAGCSSSSESTGGLASPSSPQISVVRLLEDLAGRQVFPGDNWWNADVSSAPVDPQSDAYIRSLGGAGRYMHPDFGRSPYGLPYVTVGASQPRVPIGLFRYAAESDNGFPGDAAGYPIPEEAKTLPNYIEGGVPGGGSSGDRHLLIIDRDRWLLYELFAAEWNPAARQWEAGSGAIFNLASNSRRPEGWTSTDAAGLAVFPGLVRYDEVFGPGEITHAFRFTAGAVNGHVWPASHTTWTADGYLPLGARLRLKASVDLSGYPPPVRKIFEAMKKHGLILADIGVSLFVQGTMDSRWDNGVLNPAFHSIKATDFEVIQLGWR